MDSKETDLPAPPKQNPAERFFSDLGPGLVTGCADDDPSGISTYSMAGAVFGYALLWTALISFPLMVSVQMMCGRLGMVTGRGLAGVIRRRYSKWILWGACSLLIVANVVNIAADLGGMADATQMVTGVNALVWTPLYTALIVSFLFWSSYRQIARIFKWITLVLLAYVITAFFAGVDWHHALLATLIPHPVWSRDYVEVLVGILGTTISPYLFFWQASQEVEEERAMGRPLAQRRGATAEELRGLRVDVITGMFASNFIMYFCEPACSWRREDRHRQGGRRSAPPAGRKCRIPALYVGTDWNRHARSAGARRILRLCYRGSFSLARIFGEKAAWSEKILLRAGGRNAVGPRD